tara:strand:- start:1054 stop:1569 length:516 start_codon:yes stop_codon:yes gene_type:complete
MNTIDEMIAPLVERLATRVEDKWINSRYEIVKAAAMTPKGDFGEEVTATLIKELVGMPAEIINGGKGEFDILTESKVTFENKLATEDTHGGFQFNGLKKDVDYDYAFCLGISPNDLWFGIWTKKEVEELTTSMTKDGSDSFKLSARKSARAKYSVMPLTPENFKREVSKIV